MSSRVVVLASGRGSNFEAIHRAVGAGRLGIEIVAVLSDQPQAAVLEKAKRLAIPARALVPEKNESREVYDQKLIAVLQGYQPEWIILAGFMRILTRAFIEAWRDAKGLSHVVNIHPSLLPAFPGKNSYAQAFDYGCTLAGASVHLVELEVDGGPICAQKSFAIHDCQSATEVESRGLALEHELYPEVLSWLCAGKYRVEKRQGGRIRVCPS